MRCPLLRLEAFELSRESILGDVHLCSDALRASRFPQLSKVDLLWGEVGRECPESEKHVGAVELIHAGCSKHAHIFAVLSRRRSLARFLTAPVCVSN